METKNIYFISGIDTDAGKSYCTAWYARELMQRGLRVITQKFIQTGNTGHSEDIDLNRVVYSLQKDCRRLRVHILFSVPVTPVCFRCFSTAWGVGKGKDITSSSA